MGSRVKYYGHRKYAPFSLSSQLRSCRVPELKLPLEVPLKDDFRVPFGTSFKCDSREESPRSSVTGPRPLFEVDLNNTRCVKDKVSCNILVSYVLGSGFQI